MHSILYLQKIFIKLKNYKKPEVFMNILKNTETHLAGMPQNKIQES